MCGAEGVYGIGFFFFFFSDFAIWSLLSLGFDFQGVKKGLSLPLSHQMARINTPNIVAFNTSIVLSYRVTMSS
jgi:hypothetical protein